MARSKQSLTQFAQGDLLFTKVDSLPKGEAKQVKAGERFILALGEATGHHHSFVAPKGGSTVIDEGQVTYMTLDELTSVTHQEHAPVELSPGTWQVVRQREATDDDEQWQNVVD